MLHYTVGQTPHEDHRTALHHGPNAFLLLVLPFLCMILCGCIGSRLHAVLAYCTHGYDHIMPILMPRQGRQHLPPHPPPHLPPHLPGALHLTMTRIQHAQSAVHSGTQFHQGSAGVASKISKLLVALVWTKSFLKRVSIHHGHRIGGVLLL